jgi:hypothetical protein
MLSDSGILHDDVCVCAEPDVVGMYVRRVNVHRGIWCGHLLEGGNDLNSQHQSIEQSQSRRWLR